MKYTFVKVVKNPEKYYNEKTKSYDAPSGFCFRTGKIVKVGNTFEFELELLKIEK